MFHLNIRSLASHFEELQASLGLCKFPFDIIHVGISETKHIDDHNLTTNVSLEGYSLHSQPTKSAYILAKKGIFNENFRLFYRRADENSEEIEFSIFLLTSESISRTLLICKA